MPPTRTADPDVLDDGEHGRYEIRVDGQAAGVAFYERSPGRVVFTHTEIEPAFEGRGLGGRLAQAALDDVRARDERVVPHCPFIAGWIRRHPEYAGLVAP